MTKEPVKLWKSPKVDILMIVTTGRFTGDAIDWVETVQRQDLNEALSIELVADSKLELILAARPSLVAKFGLR